MPNKPKYWGVVVPLPAPMLTAQAQQLDSLGMEGLFALNGALCLAAMAIVKTQVPDSPASAHAAPTPGTARAGPS